MRRRVLEATGLGLVSYAAARVALWFQIEPEGMATFWFVNGVVLAVLLRRPLREWALLLAATFVGFAANALLTAHPVYPDLVYGLGNVVEPLLAAVAIRHFAPRFDIGSLRALRVLILSSVAACLVSATLAALVGPIRWWLWFADDLLGMLLAAPAILVFWPPDGVRLALPKAGRLAETALIACGLTVTTAFVFLRAEGSLAHHLFYAVVPFLLWSALRFRQRGAVLACLLLAALTIGFTIQGHGPFVAGLSLVADRSLSIQAVMAVLLLSHLALGVALTERERLATLGRIQIETLERIAAGEPLSVSLDRIVRQVEAHGSDIVSSILLLDAKERRLVHGAAPHLPEEYNRAIDGTPIGLDAGSCGAAAARGERVLIADIATHPNWASYKHLALPHGLRACWSAPIFSPAREVLGTFAIYYREKRLPNDDEVRWVEAATHLASIAILRDRGEQDIRRSEARLRQLIETTHEGVWILDRQGITTYVNPRLTEILGHPAETLVGRHAAEFVHPDDRHLAQERIGRRMDGHSGQHELRLTRSDGEVRHVMIDASPILEDGAVIGALGMIADITERRNLESQVVLAQRMESLGTLAGGIAHDFNNILLAIMGNVELAKESLSAAHPARENLKTVEEASARAADLVKQILTFSRKRAPERKVIDLRPIVQEALGLLSATLPAMIRIESTFPADEILVLADPSQIHQIVMNLGTNAAHAMADHGGVLDVRLESDAPHARLTITDTGRGIDAATRSRIFEPFFTTKEPGRGTGLGLSVVLGIVKDHGGTITVGSEAGRGTTFTIDLPLAQAATDERSAASPPRDVRAHGERVLVVDDDAAILELIVTMLEGLGYDTVGVRDAAQALERLSAEGGTFDAIVTDHAMPGLTGIGFARAARDVSPTVPIVLISGYVTDDVRAAASELGIREPLSKPDMLKELPAVLRQALEGPARRS